MSKAGYQIYNAASKTLAAKEDTLDQAKAMAEALKLVNKTDYYIIEVRAVYTTRTADDDFLRPAPVSNSELAQKAAAMKHGGAK